jgi:hypothetical protein
VKPRCVLSAWVHARCDASHAVLHKNLRCGATSERIFRISRLLTVAKARGRRGQGPGVLATRWGGRRRGLCLVGRALLDDRAHDSRLRSPRGRVLPAFGRTALQGHLLLRSPGLGPKRGYKLPFSSSLSLSLSLERTIGRLRRSSGRGGSKGMKGHGDDASMWPTRRRQRSAAPEGLPRAAKTRGRNHVAFHRRANEAPLTAAKARGRHHVAPPPGRRSAAPEGRRTRGIHQAATWATDEAAGECPPGSGRPSRPAPKQNALGRAAHLASCA